MSRRNGIESERPSEGIVHYLYLGATGHLPPACASKYLYNYISLFLVYLKNGIIALIK